VGNGNWMIGHGGRSRNPVTLRQIKTRRFSYEILAGYGRPPPISGFYESGLLMRFAPALIMGMRDSAC
jgi:hypothetical protein